MPAARRPRTVGRRVVLLVAFHGLLAQLHQQHIPRQRSTGRLLPPANLSKLQVASGPYEVLLLGLPVLELLASLNLLSSSRNRSISASSASRVPSPPHLLDLLDPIFFVARRRGPFFLRDWSSFSRRRCPRNRGPQTGCRRRCSRRRSWRLGFLSFLCFFFLCFFLCGRTCLLVLGGLAQLRLKRWLLRAVASVMCLRCLRASCGSF